MCILMVTLFWVNNGLDVDRASDDTIVACWPDDSDLSYVEPNGIFLEKQNNWRVPWKNLSTQVIMFLLEIIPKCSVFNALSE